MTWKHSQNFIIGTAFFIGLCSLIFFAVGAWIGSQPTRADILEEAQWEVDWASYRTFIYVIYGLCCGAYLVLLGPALANPGLIKSFANGEIGILAMRETLNQQPGITSLVNLGPLYITLLFSQSKLTGAPLTKRDLVMLCMFIGLVSLRVFLWSERLALIETVIPIAVIWLSRKKTASFFISALPIIAVVGVGILFAVTEYFRSWTHYSTTENSLIDFAANRLFGYYATAINNGAIVFETFKPTIVPYRTADWFFQFPLFPLLGIEIGNPWDANLDYIFFSFTNPEFNNTSGIFAPIIDFGSVAGVGVWLILGVISGRLYGAYVHGRLLASLIYPTWIVGIYEILRIFYWGGPRYFPTMTTTLLLWLIFNGLLRHRLPVNDEDLKLNELAESSDGIQP
jgi:oligosaccharide repeat unit polymerase